MFRMNLLWVVEQNQERNMDRIVHESTIETLEILCPEFSYLREK